MSLFLKVPVSVFVLSLQKGQSIIAIPSSSSVQDALQVLVKHNIYSAPVGEDNVYSGFIDLVDIVTAIISSIETMITSKQSMQELFAIADTLQINKEVKGKILFLFFSTNELQRIGNKEPNLLYRQKSNSCRRHQSIRFYRLA